MTEGTDYATVKNCKGTKMDFLRRSKHRELAGVGRVSVWAGRLPGVPILAID